jgi:hypothetical protein
MLRVLNPNAIARRTRDEQRQGIGEYITPGPNWKWHIDGHDKLAHWGIEIYAAIDGYSRRIIWCYIGITNRTAYSVLCQYLITTSRLGIHPRFVQSDRGKETPLCAEAHYAMVRTTNPGVNLEDCYIYGTSKYNQRIETWWGQLEKSSLFQWRVSKLFFVRKLNNNIYRLISYICLLHTFMPKTILRTESLFFLFICLSYDK